MSNEIVAYFKGRTGVAESVYQYDYGKVLIIDGLNLPAVFEAHFANSGDDNSTTVIGQNNRVAIPNACLTKTGIVTVYIYLHTGENDGEVEYIVRFAVTQRARPAYDSTEDERTEWETAASMAIAMLQNSKKVNNPLDAYNQVTHGTAGQLLRTKGDGSTEWVDEGLPTDEQTAQAVSDWLDDHPEATTTVQDGSLTEAKFTDELKLKTVKDYVTPEMFGAKGDGVSDDAEAIQAAINNVNGLPIYFSPKVYLTSETIVLNNLNIVNDGTIKYTGEGYALELSPSSNISGASLKLGDILAENGSGLLIDTTNAWIQYLTIDFVRFYVSASGNCVYAKVIGAKWINEIRFLNGQFSRSANGVYIDHSEKTGNGYTSHWTFDRVGFEGCTHGVNIPSKVTRLSFANCRAEESISDVVYSNAATLAIEQIITWMGSPVNEAFWRNCNRYYVNCLSGFMNYRGTYITACPILYFEGMLYGLRFYEGTNKNLSDYGAYSYDSVSNKQEIDFAEVYDYSTAGAPLYERSFTRIFNMNNNNTSATETNIYLDERMFADWNFPTNSYLLELVISPNVVLNIYSKRSGTLIYSQTGGGSTTYPKLVVTKQRGLFVVQSVTVTRKTV